MPRRLPRLRPVQTPLGTDRRQANLTRPSSCSHTTMTRQSINRLAFRRLQPPPPLPRINGISTWRLGPRLLWRRPRHPRPRAMRAMTEICPTRFFTFKAKVQAPLVAPSRGKAPTATMAVPLVPGLNRHHQHTLKIPLLPVCHGRLRPACRGQDLQSPCRQSLTVISRRSAALAYKLLGVPWPRNRPAYRASGGGRLWYQVWCPSAMPTFQGLDDRQQHGASARLQRRGHRRHPAGLTDHRLLRRRPPNLGQLHRRRQRPQIPPSRLLLGSLTSCSFVVRGTRRRQQPGDRRRLDLLLEGRAHHEGDPRRTACSTPLRRECDQALPFTELD
mmetsp:Transcript_37474/g.98292  ORF Transcript_37474/g.98292 Transcript_37474/m.98292 type:complete len:331 (+) Transcript_37474:2112-3104(+)